MPRDGGGKECSETWTSSERGRGQLEFQKETKAKLMQDEELWSSAGSDLRVPIRPCASFGNCVSCCEEGSVNSETFIVLIHHRDGTVTHYKAY